MSDSTPSIDLSYLLADKLILSDLQTNGSAVTISVYPLSYDGAPFAVLDNVTELQDSYFSVSRHDFGPELEYCPNIRISRFDTQPVAVNFTLGVCAQQYQDYIVVGPSYLLLLAIPLLLLVVRHWGHRPTFKGYVLLLLTLLSAGFITPSVVYLYNHWGVPIPRENVVTLQNYTLPLDSSHPVQEFNVTIMEYPNSRNYTRIVDFTTDGGAVALLLSHEDDGIVFALPNISSSLPGVVQFTFPSYADYFPNFPLGSPSTFSVRLSRVDQSKNVTVHLSIQEVQGYTTQWIDPALFYLTAVVGLMMFAIVLVAPRDPEIAVSSSKLAQ